jgi:hypothetical protein
MKNNQELLGEATEALDALLGPPGLLAAQGGGSYVDNWHAVIPRVLKARPAGALEAVAVCMEAQRARLGHPLHDLADAIEDLKRVMPASPESVGAVVGEVFDSMHDLTPFARQSTDARPWRTGSEWFGHMCTLLDAAADLIETPNAQNLADVRDLLGGLKDGN